MTLLCLQSCALFSVDNGYAQQEITSGTSYWLNYDAARRGGFVLAEKGKKGMVLSEPAPDASASTALKLIAKAADGAQKLSGELNYEYSRTVAELAGRSQNVLILREALYRLSELYVNGAFGPVTDGPNSKVEALYTETLASLVEFAKAARIEASTRQAQEANKQAAAVGKKADELERQGGAVKASDAQQLRDLLQELNKPDKPVAEHLSTMRNSLREGLRDSLPADADAAQVFLEIALKRLEDIAALREQERQLRKIAQDALQVH